MEFDIVVTSYNRPRKVEWLANAVQSNCVGKIIIVDSGNNVFDLQNLSDKVIICRSTHKNQPYQRFLGYNISRTQWILFLDDDMEPIIGWDMEISRTISKYAKSGIIGLSFEDKHTNSFLNNNARSISATNLSSKRFNILRKITGYPILEPGEYYKNGVKGRLPTVETNTEHISGGAFLANKEYLYKNLNFELFSLYENRLGKGEDGILSYSISKLARVIMYPKQLFWHNDQGNSVYTQNIYQFNRVVSFSRLFLNREYYRLNDLPIWRARISFFNYSFWRLLGLAVNSLVKPSKSRFIALRGYFMGTVKALCYDYNKDLAVLNNYWVNEAEHDARIIEIGGKHV